MTSLDLTARRRRPTDRRGNGDHSRQRITAFIEPPNPVATSEDRALAALRSARDRGAATALAEAIESAEAAGPRSEGLSVTTRLGDIQIGLATARRILAALRDTERPTTPNLESEGN